MKKFLIIPLIIVIFLMGCTQNKKSSSTEKREGLSKKDVFSKFVDEKDLMSYILKTNSEDTISAKSNENKDITTSYAIVETIKEPRVSHTIWQEDKGDKKNESEEYVVNNVRFYRENKGGWEKELLEEKEKDNSDGKANFVATANIDSTSMLKPLENYYELTESEDVYIVALESSPEDIKEIKNILFGKTEDIPYFGDLTSLKVKFSFRKDNYYPVSFEWESKFLNKDKKVIEINQRGNYEKVNELENIEIPKEIKSLLS